VADPIYCPRIIATWTRTIWAERRMLSISIELRQIGIADATISLDSEMRNSIDSLRGLDQRKQGSASRTFEP
jgi:hypothetical protein